MPVCLCQHSVVFDTQDVYSHTWIGEGVAAPDVVVAVVVAEDVVLEVPAPVVVVTEVVDVLVSLLGIPTQIYVLELNPLQFDSREGFQVTRVATEIPFASAIVVQLSFLASLVSSFQQ